MKKMPIFLLSCFCSLFSLAQAPNFSGTWVLDKSKSKLDEKTAAFILGRTITAVQSEKEIKITTATELVDAGGQPKIDLGAGNAKIYTFDGKETSETIESPIGDVLVIRKGELKEKQLLLTSSRTFNNGQTTFVSTEAWKLSEDGTVLTIKQKSESPGGVTSCDFFYRKNK